METRRLGAAKSDDRELSGLIPHRGQIPHLHPSVFVADGARIIGDVEIEEKSSIWFNAVVRGDVNYIRIGACTNVQDNAVLHVTTRTAPLKVGSEVTIGHSAVLHGCTIDDCCLVGIGAVVLDGVHICRNSIVAAGTVILEGFNVPEGMLVAGVPAKIKRPLSEKEKLFLHRSAANYVRYCDNYR